MIAPPASMNLGIYKDYKNIHESDQDDQYFYCDKCTYEPAAPWSYLCEMCDKYFGGMRGRDRYNEDLAREKEANSNYHTSGDYSDSSDSDW